MNQTASNRILPRGEDPSRTGPIHGEISSLENSLNNAEAALAELAETIQPILRDHNPVSGLKGETAADVIAPSSELHVKLDKINDRVRALVEGMNDLRQRSCV